MHSNQVSSVVRLFSFSSASDVGTGPLHTEELLLLGDGAMEDCTKEQHEAWMKALSVQKSLIYLIEADGGKHEMFKDFG